MEWRDGLVDVAIEHKLGFAVWKFDNAITKLKHEEKYLAS